MENSNRNTWTWVWKRIEDLEQQVRNLERDLYHATEKMNQAKIERWVAQDEVRKIKDENERLNAAYLEEKGK